MHIKHAKIVTLCQNCQVQSNLNKLENNSMGKVGAGHIFVENTPTPSSCGTATVSLFKSCTCQFYLLLLSIRLTDMLHDNHLIKFTSCNIQKNTQELKHGQQQNSILMITIDSLHLIPRATQKGMLKLQTH